MQVQDLERDDLIGWRERNWLVIQKINREDHKTDLLLSTGSVDDPEWYTFDPEATLPTFRPSET